MNSWECTRPWTCSGKTERRPYILTSGWLSGSAQQEKVAELKTAWLSFEGIPHKKPWRPEGSGATYSKCWKKKLAVNNYISDLAVLQNEVEISQGKSRTKGFTPEFYQHVKKKVSILFKFWGKRESFPVFSITSVNTLMPQPKTRKLH